uniref:Uncharacterized protein n=1 Tax=Panagrolaimus sp. ES5 TaxID=591445 RepID=A0AC34G5P0_9BILA
SSSPTTEKRKPLQPQDKGETPSQNGYHPPKKDDSGDNGQQPPPLRLVRGERRDIEEEIANRILSDISEENSIAGSLASLDDVEPLLKFNNRKNRSSNRRSRSRSSTPLAEGSEGSLTPLALSPGPTGDSIDPLKEFFGENHIPNVPEFNDPSVPVGAPVFIDGLHKAAITVDLNTGKVRSSLSPRPRSGTPGTKSPILVSPGREHKMEVVIATKRGKQGRTSPMHDSADPLKKKRGVGDSDDEDDSPRKARKSTHNKDDDFDDLMDEVEKIKQKYKKGPEVDDLEKYRPKNFYKEEEDFHQKEEDIDDYPWESNYQIGPDTLLLATRGPEFNARVRDYRQDIDDYPWESNYQIGPDTLLLATRGPEFNARVRDYRREIWGDGAPLVRQGFLGYRNQDITVRERRRFTDLIREDPNVAKSIQQTTKASEQFQNGSIRKVTTTTVTGVPNATRKNQDGTYGPIFKNRLRDVCFVENAGQLILKCSVIGDPAPGK